VRETVPQVVLDGSASARASVSASSTGLRGSIQTSGRGRMDCLACAEQAIAFRQQHPAFRPHLRFSQGPAGGASGQTPSVEPAKDQDGALQRGPLACQIMTFWMGRGPRSRIFALLQQPPDQIGVIRRRHFAAIGRVSARSFHSPLLPLRRWCAQSVGLALGAGTVGDGTGQRPYAARPFFPVAGRLLVHNRSGGCRPNRQTSICAGSSDRDTVCRRILKNPSASG